MKNFEKYIPKKKKKVLFNFQMDEEIHAKLKNKLKKKDIKMVDFFNAMIESYLDQK
jgi:hypothetical protein